MEELRFALGQIVRKQPCLRRLRAGVTLIHGVVLGLGLVVLMAALVLRPAAVQAAEPVVVGSKRFTESYILGEMVRQTLQQAGVAAEHRQGLGNTAIVEQALVSGRIDVYPEYTGTILREILRQTEQAESAAATAPGAGPRPAAPITLAVLNAALAPRGLKAAIPLGFNNTYALALRAERARELGLRTLSDLAALPLQQQRQLRAAFTQEFSVRADGWPAVQKAYGLMLQPGRCLDHGLAYAALARAEVDLVDAYSTDAAVSRLGLVLLEDDRGVFPRYDAVLLMRSSLDESPLRRLQGRLDEAAMAALNGQAESGQSFEEVARQALARMQADSALAPARSQAPSSAPAHNGFTGRLLAPDLWRLLRDHVLLVVGSTALALAAGIPLGLWAQRQPRAATWILGAVGMLQTIPSLALLAALIAALGQIGTLPALIALFLYALLPIVSATHAGLGEVPSGLRQAGLALGLRPLQVLCRVELPLARPVILAGLGSAAVIGVGTATLAAFVGAGGLGERIVAGLAVNDASLMMAGAVPAAALAVAVQMVFAWLRGRHWSRYQAR